MRGFQRRCQEERKRVGGVKTLSPGERVDGGGERCEQEQNKVRVWVDGDGCDAFRCPHEGDDVLYAPFR
jgi:hypothetical protein